MPAVSRLCSGMFRSLWRLGARHNALFASECLVNVGAELCRPQRPRAVPPRAGERWVGVSRRAEKVGHAAQAHSSCCNFRVQGSSLAAVQLPSHGFESRDRCL
jgi:hypothetical protein